MCLEKRSNLLKEICRRLRYKPIIKTSDGNYTRVELQEFILMILVVLGLS